MPVTIADTTVKPGDWIYADKDGVLVSSTELTGKHYGLWAGGQKYFRFQEFCTYMSAHKPCYVSPGFLAFGPSDMVFSLSRMLLNYKRIVMLH